MRGFRGALGVCVVVVAATTTSAPAAADSVQQSASRLPTPRAATSAVWTGEHVLLFGGATDPPVDAPRGLPVGLTADIVRFTPSTGEVRTMAAKLPGPRWATSAAWDGRYAYVFGGCVTRSCDDVGEDTAQIVRYDPVADDAAVVGRLPTPRFGTAAVWAGEAAYVFGGRYAECERRFCEGEWEPRNVQRFVPGMLETTPMGTALSEPFRSAVWTGDAVLITGSSGYVLRYDPATDTLSDTGARLPFGAFASSAVWDGGRMFVFGGIDGFTRVRDIGRHDPAPNVSIVMSAKLPGPHSTGSAVWDGHHAWILGGVYHNNSDAKLSDLIVSYDPAPILPTAPRNPTAAPGPGRGEITLTWTTPLHADDISAYRVWRDDTFAGESATTAFRDAGLGDAQLTGYRISAVNAVGEGPRSSAVTQLSPALPGPPVGLSAAPGPLLGQITLDWQPPGEAGGVPVRYTVLRDGAPVATVEASKYVDRGLPAGQVVSYRVQATNIVGAGSVSNEVAVTTPTVPSAPRDLTAVPGPGRGEITVRWQTPEHTWGAPVTYEVFADGTLLANTSALRTFTHAGLADGEAHGFEVRALNTFGAGPLAPMVSAHAPRLPVVGGVTAQPGADEGQVLVRWEPDASGGVPVGTYRIFRDGELVGALAGDFTSFVDTGLAPDSSHVYRADATNVAGTGEQSAPASSAAQAAPLAQEAAAAVVLSGNSATPSADVSVRNGGTVVFTSFLSSHNPRDAASEGKSQFCFDYRREHEGRQTGTGTIYRLTFRYDPATGGLRVSTDGGQTFRECPAGTGVPDPERVVVPYLFGPYYEDQAGSITVRT